jgi:hypothetical protein
VADGDAPAVAGAGDNIGLLGTPGIELAAPDPAPAVVFVDVGSADEVPSSELAAGFENASVVPPAPPPTLLRPDATPMPGPAQDAESKRPVGADAGTSPEKSLGAVPTQSESSEKPCGGRLIEAASPPKILVPPRPDSGCEFVT